MVPAKSPLLPSHGAHWLPSVLPVGQSPSTHTIPCSWGSSWTPTQLCSGQRMGAHMSPYLARSSDTLFLRDAHGLGLPHSWEGSLWVAHSQEQGAPPQRSRSGTSAALGWVLGARWRRRFRASPRAFATPAPSPGAARSPSRAEASPAVPAGGPQPQGGARLAYAPAAGASGFRWGPPRAWSLYANGPPPPLAFLLAAPPPRARPAPGRPGPAKKP